MTQTQNAKKWLVAFLAVALFFAFMPAMAQNSFAAKAQKVSKIVKTSTKKSSYTLAKKGKAINLKAKVTYKKKVSKSAASKALKITTSNKANVKIAKKTFKKKSSKVYIVTVKAQAVKAGKSAKIAVKARSGAAKAKKGVSWTVKVTKAAAVQKVKIDNETPRVGNILKAVAEPAGAEIATYSWMINGVEVATTATYKVAEADVGKAVSVKVTGKNGGEATSDAFTVYQVEAKLIDKDGLQADGTALIGDVLQVTYAADIGTPNQVTWYCDGTAIETQNASNALFFERTANEAGTWNAVITTTKGETFTSNSIVVTQQEKAAVFSDVIVADDYDTPRVDLATDDDNAILTVTMNKDYAGDIYLFKENEEQYKKGDAVTGPATYITNPAVFSVPSKGAFKDSKVGAPGGSLKYTDPATHAVSYKFILDELGKTLTRGDKYQVVFDQENVEADDITTAKNTNVNKAGTITIPYVNAPDSVKITTKKSKVTIPGWKATLYQGENKAKWITKYGLQTEAANATLKLFSDVSTDTTGGTIFGTTDNKVEAGATQQNNAAQSTPANATDGYVYAVFEAPKGIYGAEAFKLTSAAAQVPGPVVNGVTISNNPSTDAKDVTVKFSTLKNASKVYLLTADWDTNVNKTAENAVNTFNGNNAKNVAVLDAAKGAPSVTFQDVITEVSNKKPLEGDVYTVVVVPTNTEEYAPYEVMTEADGAISVQQEDTTYILSPSAYTSTGIGQADTGIDITVKDQYGEKISAPGKTPKPIPDQVMTVAKATNQAALASAPKVEMTNDGSIKLTAPGNDYKKGDIWKLQLNASCTLYAEVTADIAAGNTKWSLEIK